MGSKERAVTAMQINALSPACGVEITGADARALSDDEVATIERLLCDHGVVVLRDQSLDIPAQRAFAARFGDPMRFPFGAPVRADVPEVHAIATDGSGPKVGNADIWHADATFMPAPPMVTMLRAVELPPSGGDTLFSSMYGAYEMLSPAVRALVDECTATHDFRHSVSHRSPLDDEYPPVSHPMARTHPVTGRRALYVNRIFTVRIDGVRDRESEALLPMLCDLATTPDLQCRVRWAPGSVVMWDNRCVQHYATYDYAGPRVMHRLLLAGDRPA